MRTDVCVCRHDLEPAKCRICRLGSVDEHCLYGGFRFFTSGEDAASPLAVTEEDIARGWQLCEVRTNSNISYTMPEGATLASNWWVRGAFEDCSIVRLGDCSIGGYVSQSNNLNNPNNQTMSFPFGTNEYSSLWAFSWGKGGHCCCPRYDDDDPYEPQEDDGPYAAGASVSFSESVVIFEDSKFSRLRRDCSRFLPCDYRRRNLDAA